MSKSTIPAYVFGLRDWYSNGVQVFYRPMDRATKRDLVHNFVRQSLRGQSRRRGNAAEAAALEAKDLILRNGGTDEYKIVSARILFRFFWRQIRGIAGL